jgi:hypothetical protein
MVIGGYACILHGLTRTTEDVDILVQDSEDNLGKVIAGLARMHDGAARELTPEDFRSNLVIKVADEVEVDVSTRAWKVSYEDAVPEAVSVVIQGVKVPFLGINSLLASKSTYREKDQLDAQQLRMLKERTAKR